jgi:hypothetical protein
MHENIHHATGQQYVQLIHQIHSVLQLLYISQTYETTLICQEATAQYTPKLCVSVKSM